MLRFPITRTYLRTAVARFSSYSDAPRDGGRFRRSYNNSSNSPSGSGSGSSTGGAYGGRSSYGGASRGGFGERRGAGTPPVDYGRGVLNHVEAKRTDRSPDMEGFIVLTREALESMQQKDAAGEEMRVRVSGWKKEKDGSSYVSLALSKPRENREFMGQGSGQSQSSQDGAQTE